MHYVVSCFLSQFLHILLTIFFSQFSSCIHSFIYFSCNYLISIHLLIILNNTRDAETNEKPKMKIKIKNSHLPQNDGQARARKEAMLNSKLIFKLQACILPANQTQKPEISATEKMQNNYTRKKHDTFLNSLILFSSVSSAKRTRSLTHTMIKCFFLFVYSSQFTQVLQQINKNTQKKTKVTTNNRQIVSSLFFVVNYALHLTKLPKIIVKTKPRRYYSQSNNLFLCWPHSFTRSLPLNVSTTLLLLLPVLTAKL